MKGLRIFAALSGVFFTLLLPAASQDQSPGANPTFRTTSNVVVLDVVVIDHGHPVQGLTWEGFHIFEDGREQTVKVFEAHRAGEPHAPQPPPPLPPSTYSNFPDLPAGSAANVLLLDALNTPLVDQMYVRKQMIDYLKTVPPQSYMAIFALGSRLRLVQGFTAKPASLVASLQDKQQTPAGSSLLTDATDSTSATVANSATDVGMGQQDLDAIHQFQADTAVFQADLRVQNTLAAMNQLANYLGVIPGRKNLIWLSGSFPISFAPDATLTTEFSVQREYSTQIKDTSDRLTASRIAVYPVDVRGLLSSPALSAANRNPGNAGIAHPSGGSIAGPSRGRGGRRARTQASGNVPNPNTFATDDATFIQQTAAEHASMQQIAEETGGAAFYDDNDIKGAVAQAIENGTNYYTLVYVPEDKKLDGRFRKIRVEFVNPESEKKDYQLAYRHGYSAESHPSRAVAPLTPASSVIQRGAPPSSQILFKVRLLPEDDPALAGLKSQPGPAGFLAEKLKGKTKRYWIDFAGDMHQIEFSRRSDGLFHGSVEFFAVAYDRDGKLLNVVNRTLKLDLQPSQYEKAMQTGLPAHEELDIPAGEIYLRLGLHDLSTDRIGTTEVPLMVKAP